MSCEQHKKALIEAAASNEPLPPDLRAHVDACASCRATFESERRLFAAIDSGLSVVANPAVPASLLPTVHLRFVQEDAVSANARLRPSPNWIYLAAAAALVFALVPLYRSRQRIESELQRSNKVAEQSIAHTGPALQQPPSSALEHPAITRFHQQRRSTLARRLQPPAPEVLVPVEEREALANYITNSSRRKSSITVDRVSVADQPTKPLMIDALNIAAINEQDSKELDQHGISTTRSP